MLGLTIPVAADEVDSFARSGEVTGNATWSETRVYGSGATGGGHVGSTVTQRDRFFLKSAASGQTEIDLHGVGFGVSEGHRVTAVYARKRGAALGQLVGLRNHTTDREAEIAVGFNNLSGTGINGCVAVVMLFLLPPWLFFQSLLIVQNGLVAIAIGIGSFVAVIPFMKNLSNKRKATIAAIRAKIAAHYEEALPS
jgi:hypothetical protein